MVAKIANLRGYELKGRPALSDVAKELTYAALPDVADGLAAHPDEMHLEVGWMAAIIASESPGIVTIPKARRTTSMFSSDIAYAVSPAYRRDCEARARIPQCL
jgi:hypothetical protein